MVVGLGTPDTREIDLTSRKNKKENRNRDNEALVYVWRNDR